MTNRKIDNTPYWSVDPYRSDISYLCLAGRHNTIYFDVEKEETVQHLLSAIHERGDKIYIGFTYYNPKLESFWEGDVIKLAQFGQKHNNICHASVWLGEHVATLAASSANGISITGSPLTYGQWELVSLPFTNIPLAFRIAVDISNECSKMGIHYESQTNSVLMHILARLLIPGHKEDSNVQGDYDPDSPKSWLQGVHCSQLVILFLKRCVLHGALYIHPKHRERLLNTYSFTCLPASLRVLLAGIWGGSSEFQDYWNVGKEVQKAWYPHDFSRDTVPLFK